MKKGFKYSLRRAIFLYMPIILIYDLMFILYFIR